MSSNEEPENRRDQTKKQKKKLLKKHAAGTLFPIVPNPKSNMFYCNSINLWFDHIRFRLFGKFSSTILSFIALIITILGEKLERTRIANMLVYVWIEFTMHWKRMSLNIQDIRRAMGILHQHQFKLIQLE